MKRKQPRRKKHQRSKDEPKKNQKRSQVKRGWEEDEFGSRSSTKNLETIYGS